MSLSGSRSRHRAFHMPPTSLPPTPEVPARTRLRLLSALAAIGMTTLLFGCGELKSATEYLYAGNEAFKAGDYKTAESEYRQAVRLEPKSETALNNLGVVLNEVGRSREAVDTLKQAVAIDPTNSIAYYTLSKALIKQEQYVDAIAAARKSIELAPTDLNGHRALAEASLLKARKDGTPEDLKVAVDSFNYVLQVDPDDDAAHQSLGEGLAQQKDTEGAMSELKKAIELNPDNKEARKALAELLHNKGQDAEALKEIDAVLDSDKSDSQARKLHSLYEHFAVGQQNVH